MSLTLTAQNETEFKPVPAGSHHASCIRIIDLGTQLTEFQNERKEQHKVLIQWEIHADGDEELLMSDGRPFIVSKRYTASLHSKSQLSADLRSWRGRDFTPEELQAFDLRNILGKTCLLSIAHETSTDGQRTYANIASISNKMKSFVPPKPENAVFAFDLGVPDWEIFQSLHEKIREQIKKSPEYAELAKPVPPPPPVQRESGNQPANPVAPLENIEDDIPF